MAYAAFNSTGTPNPARLDGQPIAGKREWQYDSTHTQAEAAATGFFTDGQGLGMKVGDSMKVHGSTTFVITSHAVITVTSTGASLSTGSIYSS